MITINLDPSFEPYGSGQNFKSFLFPSGCEMSVQLQLTKQSIRLTTRIKCSDDIMLLLLATDALKRMGVKEIQLLIPFLPYARQDRVMVEGEALSLKVFADLLNSQGYSKVSIYDPHSDVALALINNSRAITNHDFVSEVLFDKKNFVIVSPDAGAYKKIFKVCQAVEFKGSLVLANKIRDVKTGHIKSVTIDQGDLLGKDCYIIDDICDGGGTFNLLAKELRQRNCGNVNLIVSHGIFSQGLKELHENITHIYTTNSFMDINHDTEFFQHNIRCVDMITQIKPRYEASIPA
jgi:ribose-phosphate pyrophosphokinase